MDREQIEKIGKQVIDALFEVHRELGPGLLENAYEMALSHEFTLRRLAFERQKAMPIAYKGVNLECGFRLDVLVADEIVLELKSVEVLLPIHDAQLVNYLRLSGKRIGFLVNFNVPRLKEGIKRRVNKLGDDSRRPKDFILQ
jgi:GxxExxY protein